jgi:hypothetical protein
LSLSIPRSLACAEVWLDGAVRCCEGAGMKAAMSQATCCHKGVPSSLEISKTRVLQTPRHFVKER